MKYMTRKASVVIEKDELDFYVRCPELKGCHSQGRTLDLVSTSDTRKAVSGFTLVDPDGLESRSTGLRLCIRKS